MVEAPSRTEVAGRTKRTEEEELAFESRALDDQYHERYGAAGDHSSDWSERALRHIVRELHWLREQGIVG